MKLLKFNSIKTLIISIVCLATTSTFAHDVISPIGGRATAMGGCSVASKGLWSIQNNPAGLAGLEHISLGLYYENRWMLPETAYKCGAFALPVNNFGTIGLSFNQFGSEKYSENKFGLAYAKAFGQYLQIGLQLDYLTINTTDSYNKLSAVTFELGIQSQVTDKLTLGTYVFNPIDITLKETINHEKLPIAFRFGASYLFTKGFTGQCELERNTARDGLTIRGGLEYEALKNFYLRAGLQANPGILSFGLGYEISIVQINVAAQLHQQLGNTIQVGMIFSF